MSLALPPANHPLREHIDVAQLAAIGGNRELQSRLPAVQAAKRCAAAFFAQVPEARAMHALILRMDGTLQLWRFGSRGGARAVWTFGAL